MKNKFFIVIILCCLFQVITVNASTNTYERSSDNLLVPDYVTVTESNLNNILSTPAVDASEKVYDYADLFSEEEESSLYDQISSYISDSNFDMAIVTINSNSKGSSQIYADDFYDYNAFGTDSSRSGLLLLIDMDYREIYIATTGAAISVYGNNRYNDILDYIAPFMTAANYYTASSNFVKVATAYANLDSSDNSRYTINGNGELVKDNSYLWGVLIFTIIGTAIVMFIMVRMNKMVFKAASSREYLNKDTKEANVIKDSFKGSFVNKVKIDHDSNSGGGIHSGSSGTSHGGGGRGF